jgi:hypothetical protein
MTEKDQTIVLTRKAGSKEWSAGCLDYPEQVTAGSTATAALSQYNLMLWRMHYDNQDRLDKCYRLLRNAIRRSAGIPEWALQLPFWILWNKKERAAQHKRMTEIVKRLGKAPNLKDSTYEEITKLCIAEFNGLIRD